jgi:hypothetical protein
MWPPALARVVQWFSLASSPSALSYLGRRIVGDGVRRAACGVRRAAR